MNSFLFSPVDYTISTVVVVVAGAGLVYVPIQVVAVYYATSTKAE